MTILQNFSIVLSGDEMFSKQVKQKALTTSAVDLKNEYAELEDNMKFLLFTGQKQKLKECKKSHKQLQKALLYQHTKAYQKKIFKRK